MLIGYNHDVTAVVGIEVHDDERMLPPVKHKIFRVFLLAGDAAKQALFPFLGSFECLDIC